MRCPVCNGSSVPNALFCYQCGADLRIVSSKSSQASLINLSGTTSPVHVMTGHTEKVNTIAFSPNGQLVASGSDDRSVKLWRTGDGSLQRQFVSHDDRILSVGFSQDGQLIYAWTGRWTNYQVMYIWNIYTGELLDRPHVKRDDVLRGNNQSVIFLRGVESFMFLDMTIRGADYANQYTQLEVVFRSLRNSAVMQRYKISKDISACTPSVSPYTETVVEVSPVTVRNMPERDVIHIWKYYSRKGLYGLRSGYEAYMEIDSPRVHPGRITAVSLSPDDKYVASVGEDTKLCIWSIVDGRALYTEFMHPKTIKRMAFSPDSQSLAAVVEPDIHIRRSADGTLVQTLQGHTQPIQYIAFSPDSKLIAAGSADKNVYTWRIA